MRRAVSDAIVGAALDVQQFSGVLDDGLNEIGFVVRKMALEDGGEALQTHAGIDGRFRQRCELAIDRAIKLHENKIPNFDKAAAAIERKLFVLAAFFGSRGAEIVMNFRAGTARTGFAHLPEVIFFIEPEDAALWERRRLSARDLRRRHLRERR